MKIELKDQQQEQLIAYRRWLHQYPELSRHEKETSAFVAAHLKRLQIPFVERVGGYGVIGIIEGTKEGKTIGLRADMDALPIQECNDVPYASVHPHVMHACGHDAHTAMLLMAGELLYARKEKIAGRIILIFQPAEEDSPLGGAQLMMEDPVFQKYFPDVIFGQHVWPHMKVGEIGIRDEVMMGASDRFTIQLVGKGGHASMPHQTSDCVVAMAHLVTSIQTIVSRSIDPLQSGVVTIGTVDAGYAPNIISDFATLKGSVRTYRQAERKKIQERLIEITAGIERSFRVKVSVDYENGYEATVNHPKWARFVRKRAQQLFGELSTPEINPSLAAEDFGRFLLQIPGAFFLLGTQVTAPFVQKPLHDPQFLLDERALSLGVRLLVKIALDACKMLGEEV